MHSHTDLQFLCWSYWNQYTNDRITQSQIRELWCNTPCVEVWLEQPCQHRDPSPSSHPRRAILQLPLALIPLLTAEGWISESSFHLEPYCDSASSSQGYKHHLVSLEPQILTAPQPAELTLALQLFHPPPVQTLVHIITATYQLFP